MPLGPIPRPTSGALAQRRLSAVVLLLGCAATATSQGPVPSMRWALNGYQAATYRRVGRAELTVLEPAPKPSATDAAAANPNLCANGGFEDARGAAPRFWSRLTLSGKGTLAVDRKVHHRGGVSVRIASTEGIDAEWRRRVSVEPHTTYRLRAFLRIDRVSGIGAHVGIHELGHTAMSEPVHGTKGWTEVVIEFATGELKTVHVCCALGGWWQSRGTAWFDDVSLQRIGSAANTKLLQDLLPGPRMPSRVQGKDLDPKRQFLAAPVRDPRDLPALFALDLRRTKNAAKLKRQTLEIAGFEPIWIDTTFDSVSPDGSQRITVEFTRGKARRAPVEPPKRVRNKVGKMVKVEPKAPEPRPGLSGRLELVRQLDFATARVAGWKSDLQFEVEMPEGSKLLPGVQRCRITAQETWTYLGESHADDGAFQARVSLAIRDGARHLREEASKGRLTLGRLALVVLTLIKAEEDPSEPMVQRLLAKMRKGKLKNTYDLAVSLMALEAAHAPKGERDALLHGHIDKPLPRNLSAEDRTLMKEWVDTLLGNIDQRVDPAYMRRWNYTPADRFDNSNTQYALLGLYTAALCGIEISPQVWYASAEHWLRCQAPKEPGTAFLDLVSLRSLKGSGERAAANPSRRTVSRVMVPARGWGYTGANRGNTTGSMTTAGITGLVICDSALRALSRGTPALQSRIDKAVQSGFSWLAKQFTVNENPRHGKTWHYYYLYGVERACELAGVAAFNGTRWYFEGAEYLLAHQRPDGGWANLEDTCFAVLFLKKAAPPVVSGGR